MSKNTRYEDLDLQEFKLQERIKLNRYVTQILLLLGIAITLWLGYEIKNSPSFDPVQIEKPTRESGFKHKV